MREKGVSGPLILGALCAFFVALAVPSQVGSACDEKVFDDGTIENAFFYTDSMAVMARKFEGSFSPVGMEWGEINTISLGERFYPWPDSTYDPIEVTIWEGDSLTGLPVYPPIWTTVVVPSDSPQAVRVYPPGTVQSNSGIIFLGMRNPEYPDGAEGLAVDAERDTGGTYLSMDGGQTWIPTSIYGDWHIRACLIYPDAVEEAFEGSVALPGLKSVFPNPVRRSAVIEYCLDSGCQVNVGMYDVTGCPVKSLVTAWQPPGTYRVEWDGRGCADGMYFCRLTAGSRAEVRKLVLLR